MLFISCCRTAADELMGVNRNLDNEEGIVDHFEDERACKAYMCGLCPHDLFRFVLRTRIVRPPRYVYCFLVSVSVFGSILFDRLVVRDRSRIV